MIIIDKIIVFTNNLTGEPELVVTFVNENGKANTFFT